MNSALDAGAATAAAAPVVVAEWVYDPWRERPRIAAAALVASAGLCAVVIAAREPFLVAVALCAFCIASFAPALARTHVRLDAGGAARRALLGWERRRWSDVRRMDELPAAAVLSPFPRRHWLDMTRALTLPLPAARRSELLATLRSLREGRDDARA